MEQGSLDVYIHYAGSTRYPTHLTRDPSDIRNPWHQKNRGERSGQQKKNFADSAMSYARLDGPNIRAQCHWPVHEYPTRRFQGRERGNNASDQWGKRNEMINECGKREGVRCAHRSLIRHHVSIGEEKKMWKGATGA